MGSSSQTRRYGESLKLGKVVNVNICAKVNVCAQETRSVSFQERDDWVKTFGWLREVFAGKLWECLLVKVRNSMQWLYEKERENGKV